MADLPERVDDALGDKTKRLVPQVYADTLQPAAREIGNILGRSVRAALFPVRGAVWSWERAEEWLEQAVTERLEQRRVSAENVVTPRPQLAAGVIRGVQAAGPEGDPSLRDFFANLLAAAVDSTRSAPVHPAFAEILAQITPDESRLLLVIARRMPSGTIRSVEIQLVRGVLPVPYQTLWTADILPEEATLSAPELLDSYLDNLERLGIVKRANEAVDCPRPTRGDEDLIQLEAERAQRGRLMRAYLGTYGVPKAREAQEDFDLRAAAVSAPDGSRPRIALRAIWPTSFGEHLLQSVVDPDQIGVQSGVEIEDYDIPDGAAKFDVPAV